LGGHDANQKVFSFASRFAARPARRGERGRGARGEERGDAADLVLGASGVRPGRCRVEKGGRAEKGAECGRACLCCSSGESGGEDGARGEQDEHGDGDGDAAQDAGQGG